MDWTGYGLVRACHRLDMGWAGHGVGVPWAGLVWDILGLERACAGADWALAGSGLGWPWAGLAVDWLSHGLG
jgi:hypothetical protein